VASWATTFASGVNHAYADANGDGIVNSADLTALEANYQPGSTIGTLSPLTAGSATLGVELSASTADNNDAITADISLGTATVPANNVYGIAFTITFNPLLVDPASIDFNLNNSWLGNLNSDLLSVQYTSVAAGRIEVAVTRVDHTNVSGYGSIGSLSFNVTSTPFQSNQLLTIGFTNIRLINAQEMILPIALDVDDLMVNGTITTVSGTIGGILTVYPNPGDGHFSIDMNTQSTAPVSIQICDANGIKVYEKQNSSTLDQRIDLSDRPAGLYMMIVIQGDNKYTVKLIRQ